MNRPAILKIPVARLAALACLALAFAGCGRKAPEANAVIDYRTAQAMSGVYTTFMADHGGQPPKTEEEFRKYLMGQQDLLGPDQLTVEKMFQSPRNGQPLDWVYGRTPPLVTPDVQGVAYERTPVEGKRLVIGMAGRYAEVDEAAFKSAFPNVK